MHPYVMDLFEHTRENLNGCVSAASADKIALAAIGEAIEFDKDRNFYMAQGDIIFGEADINNQWCGALALYILNGQTPEAAKACLDLIISDNAKCHESGFQAKYDDWEAEEEMRK